MLCPDGFVFIVLGQLINTTILALIAVGNQHPVQFWMFFIGTSKVMQAGLQGRLCFVMFLRGSSWCLNAF